MPYPAHTARLLVVTSFLIAAPRLAHSQVLADSVVVRIDSVFAAFDHSNTPGCALAVFRDGQFAYRRGYGMANLEHGIAITPRSVFDIGSTSKQFAAASMVLLAIDGKLGLDDEVQKYLPELPRYQKPVTIRHLLNHTSGLRDYLTLMGLRGTNFDGVTTDRDAYDLVVRQRALNFEPGSEWLYSNTGYFLLSQIIKHVTGQTFAQFAKARIFDPLGMRDTHIHDDHTMIVPMRATGYEPNATGYAISMSGFEQTGDGAVNTTVEDLLKWDANFYTPVVGGERLLRELETQGTLNNGTRLDYALGLFIDQHRGLRRVRHGGAWAGYRADLVRFPGAHTSVASLCNFATAQPSEYVDRVADIVLRDRFAPVASATSSSGSVRPSAAAVSAAQLQRLAGRYRNPHTEETRTIGSTATGLASNITRQLAWVPDDSLHYTLTVAPLTMTFELDARGQGARLTERSGSTARGTFERFEPVTLTSAQLQEYAGTYWAEEINAPFIVTASERGLVVRLASGDETPFVPSVRDVFVGDGQLGIAFARDARKHISGLTVNAGRVRGIVAIRR